MICKSKYHHIELTVYTEGESWKVMVQDPPRPMTAVENSFSSQELAKDAALLAADGHLKRHFPEINYASLPAERIRWVEVKD